MGSLHDPVLDDVRDFKVCDDAMDHLGMTQDERFSVYTIVASVLHLGNIRFEDNHEDTKGTCVFEWLTIKSLNFGEIGLCSKLFKFVGQLFYFNR